MSTPASSGARDTTNFWENPEFQGVPNSFEEMFRLMEMFWSNADRVSWNPQHKFDTESTYAEGYRERGAPEPLVPALSMYSQVMEPDFIGLVGDLMRGPRAVGAATDVAQTARAGVDPNEVYQVVRDADGNPVTTWRVQQAGGGGVGPIATDLGLPPSNARYHGEFDYVTDLTKGDRSGADFVWREGNPKARPGGVLDIHGVTGTDPSDLFNRIEPSAMEMVRPEFKDILQQDFDDYRRGYISGQDLMDTLRGMFGNNLSRYGDIPGRSRLDTLFQMSDDGRGGMLEVVTFGGDATWTDRNIYTADELLDLRMLMPKRR